MADQVRNRRTPGVVLPSGEELPAFGLGTHGMGRDPRHRDRDLATLRTGVDLGLTVVDTTWHDHPDGQVEELVAEAITGRRDDLFLIAGLPPAAASRLDILRRCEESLRRLRTDRIDLYLLPWREAVGLEEIVEALNLLITDGRIRHWGVGDFDVPDLVELTAVAGGTAVEVNQVRYDLRHRGIEQDLLPRCRAARLPVLARSPVPTPAPDEAVLARMARRYDTDPAEVGLAWVLGQEGVYAIVEVDGPDQVRRRRRALELRLTGEDLDELDRAYPAPATGSPGTAATWRARSRSAGSASSGSPSSGA